MHAPGSKEETDAIRWGRLLWSACGVFLSFLLANLLAFLNGQHDGYQDSFLRERNFMTVVKSPDFENLKACIEQQSRWLSLLVISAAFSAKSAFMIRKPRNARAWALMALSAAAVVVMESAQLAVSVADFFGAIPARYSFGSHWSLSLVAPSAVCEVSFAVGFAWLVFGTAGHTPCTRVQILGIVAWVMAIVATSIAVYWAGVGDGRANEVALRLRHEDPLIWKSTVEMVREWSAYYQSYLVNSGVWLLMLFASLRLAFRKPRHWTGGAMFLCAALAITCRILQITYLLHESFEDNDEWLARPVVGLLAKSLPFIDHGFVLAMLLFVVAFSIWPPSPAPKNPFG